MTTIKPPICIGCVHYHRDLTCDAFPDGIPRPIIESEHDHRQPYPGDHGIRFAPIDAEAAQNATDMFAAHE